MKKLLTLTMLICFAMICSCQKQSSTAEQQLAQRKAELDAREKALDEREKALAERENAKVQSAPIPQSRRQGRDPAQAKADIERRLQQLPPEAQTLIGTPPQMASEKEEKGKSREERIAQRLEEKERMKISDKQESKKAKSRAAELSSQPASLPMDAAKKEAMKSAYPQQEATSAPQLAPLSVYPQPEATSPTPSPTPQ